MSDAWDAYCEEHEEMLDRDCAELIRIARDLVGSNDHIKLTEPNGDTITVRIVKAGDACQTPTAEQMAYRLVNEAIEHGMIHVECSHDRSHACVCTWSERFIEHAAAMFEEFAKASKKEPRA